MDRPRRTLPPSCAAPETLRDRGHYAPPGRRRIRAVSLLRSALSVQAGVVERTCRRTASRMHAARPRRRRRIARREGPAQPDRLAGAVRPGGDRGAGVRHAGSSATLRVCPRAHHRRGHGPDRFNRRGAGHPMRAGTQACSDHLPASGAQACLSAVMAAGYEDVYRAVITSKEPPTAEALAAADFPLLDEVSDPLAP